MEDLYDGMTREEYHEYLDKIRRMTPEERLNLMFEASDKARQEVIEQIKEDHPEYTHEQIKREIIRRVYGEELYQQIAKAQGWEQPGTSKDD